MISPTEELRQKAMEGKSERQILEVKAFWALSDLSAYFHAKSSPLYYAVNKLIHQLDEIRDKAFL